MKRTLFFAAPLVVVTLVVTRTWIVPDVRGRLDSVAWIFNSVANHRHRCYPVSAVGHDVKMMAALFSTFSVRPAMPSFRRLSPAIRKSPSHSPSVVLLSSPNVDAASRSATSIPTTAIITSTRNEWNVVKQGNPFAICLYRKLEGQVTGRHRQTDEIVAYVK